ncbi:metallophosphoesterase family protein [Chondromyces apiculatus]|uniref:Serine/threonine protein phosphatase n=1 Tax=Chondromyces apiculatus DSM 436 TaxID=1192034 RepID=A0A017SUT3_9BACT|nr:metallophosphoesterase family protein [Chondromyces apiculatus]EYF00734.1 Serine/threonine protein phosphatase [Chondromyces apiculatus DSM 436]
MSSLHSAARQARLTPMPGRTFAIGDIHGDLTALRTLLGRLPPLVPTDTLVFLGDYLDRGPCSAEVIQLLRDLPRRTPARVVALRGNHEDAWLEILDHGWPEFVLPRSHGCLEALRSFERRPQPSPDEQPDPKELKRLLKGSFLPRAVVKWMRSLPYFHEDEHAIYVHAGLPYGPRGFLHPAQAQVEAPRALLWLRDQRFFRDYRGKLVVFGHTSTELLPPELSSYTPEDPADLWAGPSTVGLDTRCGRGGFLTALELPARLVYESR